MKVRIVAIALALALCRNSICAQESIKVTYRATNNAYKEFVMGLRQGGNAGLASLASDCQPREVRTMTLQTDGETSYFREDENSDEQDEISDDDGPRITIVTQGQFSEGRDVHKAYSLRTLTIAQRYVGRTYLIEDSLRLPNWKLEDDEAQWLGVPCKKATCGDTATAWYAMDIPIPDGPDAYWGLPGLILRLDDGHELYECIAIERTPEEMPRLPRGRRMSPSEFEEFVERDMARIGNRLEDE